MTFNFTCRGRSLMWPSCTCIPAASPTCANRTSSYVNDGDVTTREYNDGYGNICTRFLAPAGNLRMWNSTLIEDSGLPDPLAYDAREVPTEELPDDVLVFLLNSRYCEVDLLSPAAFDLFGHLPPGGSRVHAVVEWVNKKVTFGYQYARATKTALDVYTERVGVCRDYQHLAVAFCRASTSPPATSPATLATSACPTPAPWISAPGSKPTSTANGGPSTPATTSRVSDECSWPPAATLRMWRS